MVNKKYISKKKILKIINKTLKILYKENISIINNNANIEIGKHNSERNIVCHFSRILYSICKKDFRLKKYDIDCEYNRHLENIKELDGRQIIPDLIIHKRGTDNFNLLIIEFKGWWNNQDRKIDEEKVKNIVNKYNYSYGMTINLNKKFSIDNMIKFAKE